MGSWDWIQTKTEAGTRDWGFAVMVPTMFLFEEIQTLRMWIRKAVEHIKCSLMSHTSRSTADSGTEYDLSCGCLNQEGSEETNVNMRPRNHSCDSLVKNVIAFCPCLKNLLEAKVRRFGLIPLMEEIL